MMKPLVIYHGNCADGFSAAWCFWKKMGNEADYHAGVYQEPPPDAFPPPPPAPPLRFMPPTKHKEENENGKPAV